MIARNQRARAIGRAGWLALVLFTMALVPGFCAAVEAAHKSDGASQGAAAAADGTVGGSVLDGYRRYNASCNHCHGPDGIGSSFGPGLIEAPMDAETFRDAVLNGRSSGMSVMKGFASDPNVVPYVDDIYIYLRARMEGLVGRGRPRMEP